MTRPTRFGRLKNNSKTTSESRYPRSASTGGSFAAFQAG